MCQREKRDTQKSKSKIERMLSRDRGRVSCRLLWTMGVLGFLFTATVVFRAIAGKGVFTALIGCWNALQTVYDRLSPRFPADALFEVGKAIGLSSVLIVWIYASLDKMESGFFYSELLTTLYPNYNVFVFIHFLFLLLSLWQAKAGGRDAALLALLIVMLDCIPQWVSLKMLVLFPERRRELAEKQWDTRINRFATNKNVDMAREDIYKLANTISLEPRGNYRRLLNCFARALLEYSKLHSSMEKRLLSMQSVWDRLLAGRDDSERDLLIENVIAALEQKNDREDIRFGLCASLVLWQCMSYADRETQRIEGERDYSAILTAVCDDLALLEQSGAIREDDSVRRVLNESFSLLVWMHLLYDQIHSPDKRLFFLHPSGRIETRRAWLRALINAHFLNDSDAQRERNLEISIEQMNLVAKQAGG